MPRSRASTSRARWWSSPATRRASRASCGSSTAGTPRSPSARSPSRSRPDEAVIHKEFHLSSADPQLVGEQSAVVVGMTNYDVADQLADVGMEAIHRRRRSPWSSPGSPSGSRTPSSRITPARSSRRSYVGKQARIEIIAGSPKVTAVEIHDPSMVGTVGFDLRRHGDLQEARGLVHPQGDQRELDHAGRLGQVDHAGVPRGARERVRGGDRRAVGDRVRHRHATSRSRASSRAPPPRSPRIAST